MAIVESRKRPRLMRGESLVSTTQLAMIPRDNLNRIYCYSNPFRRLSHHHRARIIIQRPCIALPDQLAITQDGPAIVIYCRLPFDLHASQFLVALTGFSETGETRVT